MQNKAGLLGYCILWSDSIPLKVKASADLYHHLLELNKKDAEIASYTPLFWFSLQEYITL